jgi:tetratricopeptide (TPR) repeat protein
MAEKPGMRATLLAVALACGLAESAVAQGAAQTQSREAIFAQMLRDPGNVTLALRYAKLSNDAGDLEAAIGALERILFYNPGEPNARLYLGLLYAKLGSNDMARGYFESVLQHPATPEPIRARAEALLAKANARLSPHQWNNYIRTGVRYQSNGNDEPDGEYEVFDPVNGLTTVEGNPSSDWNAYVQTGTFYSYDFGNQRGDRFEASLTTYNTRNARFDDFNYNMAEATAGIRFGLPMENGLASVKPYVIATAALLDDQEYFHGGGGGLVFDIPIGQIVVSPFAEAVWREYENNDDINIIGGSQFEDRNGVTTTAGFRLATSAYAAYRFNARLAYETRDADEDYEEFERFLAEIQFPFDVDIKGHQLLITPLFGVRYTNYDAPDPTVQDVAGGDDVIREDLEFRVGLAADYAINDWAGVGAQVLYRTTDSNLDAYETDNWTVSFGPNFRF